MDDARTVAAAARRRTQARGWVTRWLLRYKAEQTAQRLACSATEAAQKFRLLAAAYGDADLVAEIDRMWTDD